METDALDSHSAAHRMGIAPSTLAKMRVVGIGPEYYKLGRRVVYRAGDIDAYMESRRRRSTSDEGAK